MKLNAGIITHRLAETKAFYTEVLGFGVTFENEWFALLHTPNREAEISFLLPDQPSQHAIFQPAFPGRGLYLTIEVPDVQELYHRISRQGVPIAVELRQEPWGDHHFAILDPNGIGVDLVTYQAPA